MRCVRLRVVRVVRCVRLRVVSVVRPVEHRECCAVYAVTGGARGAVCFKTLGLLIFSKFNRQAPGTGRICSASCIPYSVLLPYIFVAHFSQQMKKMCIPSNFDVGTYLI